MQHHQYQHGATAYSESNQPSFTVGPGGGQSQTAHFDIVLPLKLKLNLDTQKAQENFIFEQQDHQIKSLQNTV